MKTQIIITLLLITIIQSCINKISRDEAVDYFDMLTLTVAESSKDFEVVFSKFELLGTEFKKENSLSDNNYHDFVTQLSETEVKLETIENKLNSFDDFHGDVSLKNECISIVITTRETLIPKFKTFVTVLYKRDTSKQSEVSTDLKNSILMYQKAEKSFENFLRDWASKYD